MYKLGIDLGGSKIEGILLDEKLNVLTRKRIPTNQDNGYDSIINSITSLILELNSELDDVVIGVCTPGTISKKTGLLKNSNTQCLIGKPIKEDIEQILDHPILIENDANCFALAEATLGSAQIYGVVFGIIMGTGVGGGIIMNKKIYNGRTNIAGEWGHHTLFPNGNSCYCGKKGCVETYICGPALEKRWKEISSRQESIPTIINNLSTNYGKQWKTEFLENFGIALANVIDILDPDAIVLGGGLSNISFLYDEGKKIVYDKVFSDSIDTPILKNTLGDSAGVFGVCLIDNA